MKPKQPRQPRYADDGKWWVNDAPEGRPRGWAYCDDAIAMAPHQIEGVRAGSQPSYSASGVF